jgi:hypothetical protein
VAAQFELTLRQIDVIGEWQNVGWFKQIRSDAIVSRRHVWRAGLRFQQLANETLDLTTSKNATAAIFDVTAYTLFVRAFNAVPEAERQGPLVVDENGLPARRRNYQDLYGEVANAAGVPRAAWNMFARHGGVTDFTSRALPWPTLESTPSTRTVTPRAATTLCHRSRPAGAQRMLACRTSR